MAMFKKFLFVIFILLVSGIVGYFTFYYFQSTQSCMAVVTPARQIFTSKCQYFSSPCAIPPIFYEEDSWCPNDPPHLYQ